MRSTSYGNLPWVPQAICLGGRGNLPWVQTSRNSLFPSIKTAFSFRTGGGFISRFAGTRASATRGLFFFFSPPGVFVLAFWKPNLISPDFFYSFKQKNIF